MTKALWLATTMLVAAPFTASAQTGGQTAAPVSAAQAPVPTGPASQAPAVDTAQQGVLVFEPAFFASSSPNTALDMIARLPGFGFDPGNTDTRGFAGAAGNVLIDGDRPSSKSDSLDQILQRISADSVERVELIRGGAPGIDMQGRSVIANVVLKRTVQIETVLEANTYLYPDGYFGPLLEASWSRREGDNQLEASFSATTDRTDGTGDGYRAPLQRRRRPDPGRRSGAVGPVPQRPRHGRLAASGRRRQAAAERPGRLVREPEDHRHPHPVRHGPERVRRQRLFGRQHRARRQLVPPLGRTHRDRAGRPAALLQRRQRIPLGQRPEQRRLRRRQILRRDHRPGHPALPPVGPLGLRRRRRGGLQFPRQRHDLCRERRRHPPALRLGEGRGTARRDVRPDDLAAQPQADRSRPPCGSRCRRSASPAAATCRRPSSIPSRACS